MSQRSIARAAPPSAGFGTNRDASDRCGSKNDGSVLVEPGGDGDLRLLTVRSADGPDVSLVPPSSAGERHQAGLRYHIDTNHGDDFTLFWTYPPSGGGGGGEGR